MSNCPFHLLSAEMEGDRLYFRYTADGATRPGGARLEGEFGEIMATVLRPGTLVTPIPPTGGAMRLVIDPWVFPLYLSPDAVDDYHTADPCDAVLELPAGNQIIVRRVLRKPDRIVLFYELEPDGQAPHNYLSARLLFGSMAIVGFRWPYKPRPVAPGPMEQEMVVQALCFHAAAGDEPLTLRIDLAAVAVPGEWRVELSFLGDRPAVVDVGQSLPVAGGVPVRLEEVWLSRLCTSFLLTCDPSVQPAPWEGLRLTDEHGYRYAGRPGQTQFGLAQWQFEPVPAGVRRLTLQDGGLILVVRGGWVLLLAPGARRVAGWPGGAR